jgi:hypothetical protein
MNFAMSMFVMVAIIFRLHHDKDEDNWVEGQRQKADGLGPSPVRLFGGCCPAMA